MKSKNKDILIELSGIALMVVVYFLVDLLFTKTVAFTSAIIVFAGLLILFLIRFGDRRRVDALSFDKTNSIITFQYRNTLGKTKIKNLPFSSVSVEKKISSGRFRKIKGLEIVFVSNAVAEFDLTTEKDGYDDKSLEQIWITAKELGLSVKEE